MNETSGRSGGAPATGPIYAVGDIHGRSDELRRVIALIQADAARLGVARPRTVFLGDYVDRGPDSRGVLDILSSDDLAAALDPEFLLGNHEAFLIAALRQPSSGFNWLQHGGAECVESYGLTFINRGFVSVLEDLRKVLPERHKRFLSNLALTHEEGGWFFSHAGVDPARPLDAQEYGCLVWGTEGFLKHTGSYGRRVVHGHWRFPEVQVLDNRVGVDTACGFPGGKLSAVALEGDSVRVL